MSDWERRHDYWSPLVDLQDQRDKETHGEDPHKPSKFSEIMAECLGVTNKPDPYKDAHLKYLRDHRIDHVLPDGTKVSYYNEGKFKNE